MAFLIKLDFIQDYMKAIQDCSINLRFHRIMATNHKRKRKKYIQTKFKQKSNTRNRALGHKTRVAVQAAAERPGGEGQ